MESGRHSIVIRPEGLLDHDAVHKVNEIAFGRRDEADLVEALRRESGSYVSLVAELDGDVVGHIFFSPVVIESSEKTSGAVGLAPMAVLPEHQNHGIGSALVRAGLEACEANGQEIVVVLGHPGYYPRFGFTPARAKGITCEYPVPDEVFMVAELKQGALAGRTGLVKYHPAFDTLS